MAFSIHLVLSRLAIIAMLSVRHVSCVPSDVSATPTPQSCQPPTGKAIILDVDNTLYCEETLKRLTGLGIEEQIIANTHTFCKEHLDLTPAQADDLFRKYGTTIEGIRQEYPSQAETLLETFYHQVYDPIDFSSLQAAQRRAHMEHETGYSHAGNSLSSLREFLLHLPFPIYLASNSPSWHVTNILHGLGLTKIPFQGMLTPDLVTHDETLIFPTKAHPSIYYKDILQHHDECILLDDSMHNVQRANDIGMQAIHVNHDDTTLEQALSMAIGHLHSDYALSDVSYLKAKNVVDAQSIHAPTWNQVAANLVLAPNDILRVADVGAGVLSMLSLLLKGQHDKKALLQMMKVKGVEYFAYEPNMSLLEACRENLKRLGFQLQTESEHELIYHRSNQNVTVHLRMIDFTNDDRCDEVQPNLIMGCCFADLMDPHELVESLLRFTAATHNDTTLVYFPITFAGITQFLPPQPFGTRTNAARRTIPSDTTAFHIYSKALATRHGHNLDPDKLVAAMSDYGATLVHRGPSNWKIDPTDNEYLWKTMLYFFGTVGASEMMKQGYDSVGWVDRAWKQRPSIEVTNIDLLFRLDSSETVSGLIDRAGSEREDQDELEIEEIQFTAPYEVGTITKTVYTKDGAHLGPNQVEGTS
jgi:FMN phosphatase YigB (HAD superfamily)